MKKSLIIFCLFFVCIISSIISHIDCKNRCVHIIEKTKLIQTKLEKNDIKTFLDETENLKKTWAKYEKILRIYLKRKNLEEIEKEIVNLKSNSESLELKETKKNLKQIKRLCEDSIKETKPSITNII